MQRLRAVSDVCCVAISAPHAGPCATGALGPSYRFGLVTLLNSCRLFIPSWSPSPNWSTAPVLPKFATSHESGSESWSTSRKLTAIVKSWQVWPLSSSVTHIRTGVDAPIACAKFGVHRN